MPSSSPTGLLTKLRAATKAVHRELDGLSPLSSEQPTRAGYALHLRAIADLALSIETGFYASEAWKRHVPDHAQRLKAQLLCQDLEAVDDTFARDRLAPSFAIPSFGYGMGAAYVLEGSTLGGVVLARRVRAALGPFAQVRYLTAYGDQMGAMWSAFCAVLDALPEQIHDSACLGACVAFENVKRRFVELRRGHGDLEAYA